ncbi:alpha-ketoglutarate-dependent dioxygenase AlkB [Nocardioides zeae]|uniref:Alpha-ketoglutarate-dependent dioxygenase AlkB n=1 Tax=Nocardioides imazamoxiresistens TaxID=3231893 RepID=A0ABU3PY74_9ACTN|nr:alpha-ketoglutarate-dependent dioxygenase AlkB [Nocardioides zeae]MDT9594198.1 alpha-ketoglutarate-dependent dioxygenase AlkB [Nocardioides zeae]
MDFQGSLFGGLAPTAYADGVPPLRGRVERRHLGDGAWIDVARDWLATAADEVAAAMVADVPWRAERRPMYDRVVAVPRLLHTYGAGEDLPHPALVAAREQLSAHYRDELGEPFVTAGCCFYRDGDDSVAWHGDTIGRGSTHDTMVAIVSFGDPRRLALRRRGGGPSTGVVMAHGDLVVMGGSCQRTWEHAVPKVAHAGPRLSVQFRPAGVF